MITSQQYWKLYKCIAMSLWEHDIHVTVPKDILKNKRMMYLTKRCHHWHAEKVYECIFEIPSTQLITDTILESICKTYNLGFSLYYGKEKNMIMFHDKYVNKSAMYYYENNPDNENYNPND